MIAELYLALSTWVQSHGLHGVFALMAAESAGAPLPTEVGFIVAQSLMNAGLCGYWVAFAWIAAGHIAGAGVSYHLGLASDNAVARYFAHKPHVMEVRGRMQRWYARYGPLAILFGRLVGQVRPWASFVAGLARVPPLPFWGWTILGTLLYTAITIWVTKVGFAFWHAHPQLRTPLVVVVLLIFYGLPLYKLIEHLVKRHRRRRQLLALDEPSPPEVSPPAV